MPDVREMVRVKPHSERWEDCERQRATRVEGTVLYVKATMTGVMLIVVRVVRFALESVGKFCNELECRCQHKLTTASLAVSTYPALNS